MSFTQYTIEERYEIQEAYKNSHNVKSGWLDELAKKLKRPKANISRYARVMGWTDRSRGIEKIENRCEQCGNTFEQKPYERNHTCSKKCGDILGAKKRTGIKKWTKDTHPKGMLNKTHTLEVRKKMSERMLASWEDKESAYNSEDNKQKHSDHMSKFMVGRLKTKAENYSRTTKGWREIGGQKKYFRSKWEMNIAYYLEFLKNQKEIKKWEYEVETFWFEKIRRGVRSYTPDFKITGKRGEQYFIEVKGWMDAKSKTKLARMKKYYPQVKIELYDESVYKTLKRQIGRICNWE